jgi:hypothetical protein
MLKEESPFDRFIKSLVSFLGNAQIVGPFFFINPLNLNSKDSNIMAKGDISSNMTKLGVHTKISGSGNSFNKRKIWDQEVDKGGRSTSKTSKKEEFYDPTVYFFMIIYLDIAHQKIIEHTAHEWNRASETNLQIKDLQHVDSETSLFGICASKSGSFLMNLSSCWPTTV